jgi:hypothetical protein
MPQLTRITFQIGTSVNFRWPYQAKVINTFEASNKATVNITGRTFRKKSFLGDVCWGGADTPSCGATSGIVLVRKSRWIKRKKPERFAPAFLGQLGG